MMNPKSPYKAWYEVDEGVDGNVAEWTPPKTFQDCDNEFGWSRGHLDLCKKTQDLQQTPTAERLNNITLNNEFQATPAKLGAYEYQVCSTWASASLLFHSDGEMMGQFDANHRPIGDFYEDKMEFV